MVKKLSDARRQAKPFATHVELRVHPQGAHATIVLDGKAGRPLDSMQAVLQRASLLVSLRLIRHRQFCRLVGQVLRSNLTHATAEQAAHARHRARGDPIKVERSLTRSGRSRDAVPYQLGGGVLSSDGPAQRTHRRSGPLGPD